MLFGEGRGRGRGREGGREKGEEGREGEEWVRREGRGSTTPPKREERRNSYLCCELSSPCPIMGQHSEAVYVSSDHPFCHFHSVHLQVSLKKFYEALSELQSYYSVSQGEGGGAVKEGEEEGEGGREGKG